jgi:hypothetical protein
MPRRLNVGIAHIRRLIHWVDGLFSGSALCQGPRLNLIKFALSDRAGLEQIMRA